MYCLSYCALQQTLQWAVQWVLLDQMLLSGEVLHLLVVLLILVLT